MTAALTPSRAEETDERAFIPIKNNSYTVYRLSGLILALCNVMSGFDAGVYALRVKRSGIFYRRAGQVHADLDRVYRSSQRVRLASAHGSDAAA